LEAKTSLEESVPALIVLDMRLDHYNRGPELLEFIKSNPAFSETRIVIITAYSKMIDEYSDQVDLVVLKPINAKDLLVYAEDAAGDE
jgi:CheY-like chemotaxis protein